MKKLEFKPVSFIIGIIIGIILIFCLSCESFRVPPSKYHIGDVVYLKPDSIKAIITDTYFTHTTLGWKYDVRYTTDLNELKIIEFVNEILIY